MHAKSLDFIVRIYRSRTLKKKKERERERESLKGNSCLVCSTLCRCTPEGKAEISLHSHENQWQTLIAAGEWDKIKEGLFDFGGVFLSKCNTPLSFAFPPTEYEHFRSVWPQKEPVFAGRHNIVILG